MLNLKVQKIEVCGIIPSEAFQRAKQQILKLYQLYPKYVCEPIIRGVLEFEWNEKLRRWRNKFGGKFWCLKRPVAVWFDDVFIGDDFDVGRKLTEANVLLEPIPFRLDIEIKEDYYHELRKHQRPHVYLDITIDNVYVGTLNFQLYSDMLPRTCKNFKELCLGIKGESFSYKNTKIHRIVKSGWIQGGVIEKKGGRSSYPLFPDESYCVSHDRRGVLSMVNNGKNKNGTQFFITLAPCQWMDKYFVAFGQLIEGVHCLNTIEEVETYYEEPLQDVVVKTCGKYNVGDSEDERLLSRMVRKKPVVSVEENVIETIIKTILESLTRELTYNKHPADVLDTKRVDSIMKIQFYFHDLYSLPKNILESSAEYLRNLRRSFLRYLKPEATQVVEALLSDLMMSTIAKLGTVGSNLDDVREILGVSLYNKLRDKISMCVDMGDKELVGKLIDEIVKTSVNMINMISKQLDNIREPTEEQALFQNQMNEWVFDFILQRDQNDRAGYDGNIPLYTLIEKYRTDLKILRKETGSGDKDKMKLSKKIDIWMKNIVYNAETEWIKEILFDNDEESVGGSYTEEIMYGAMSVALIEMFYIVDESLRVDELKLSMSTTEEGNDKSMSRKSDETLSQNLQVELKCLGWIRKYIVEHGNEKKSSFAQSVHAWLTCGGSVDFGQFYSRHSLVTQASLLSVSLSLCEFIKQDKRRFKCETKQFVLDLWELYLEELVKQEDKSKITRSRMLLDEELTMSGELEPGEHGGEYELYDKPPSSIEIIKTKSSVWDKTFYYDSSISKSSGVTSTHEDRQSWTLLFVEQTKQVLCHMSHFSCLPRQLFSTSESKTNFDEAMKSWFKFNKYKPSYGINTTDILDYIKLHHVDSENVEDTARSFMKKQIINHALDMRECGRHVIQSVVYQVLDGVIGKDSDSAGESDSVGKLVVTEILSVVVSSYHLINNIRSSATNVAESSSDEIVVIS